MKHLFLSLMASVFCLSAEAAFVQTGFCKEALLSAETIRNESIYDTCGFNDKNRALSEWALWAEKEKAGQALYEICIRYPEVSQAKLLCQKAFNLGNGSALLQRANQLYNQKQYTEAAKLYSQALASPILNQFEKGIIAQNMGLLYMNPDTNYYNPEKGMPLILKATEQRGAEANNLMGIYALFGMQGVKQNPEESFKYLWRSVLLGCPAAEENLGFYYMGHQKKLSNNAMKKKMSERMFSCVPPDQKEEIITQIPDGCQCNKALGWEKEYADKPYRLISSKDESATLADQSDKSIFVEKNSTLPNGMKVLEINTNSVVLVDKNFVKTYIPLAPDMHCLTACKESKKAAKNPSVPRYHLSFTQKECADILYYAERLVDTDLPFTGKKECGFSADMKTISNLLSD